MTLSTKLLFNFSSTNIVPSGSLLRDANGDLFGTTLYFGVEGAGTVYELANTASGYATGATTLVSFDGSGSGPAVPFSGLIADGNGDLFGSTYYGGANGDGTVFEIVNTSTGFAATATVLASFNGTDGTGPLGGLTADANGDLFGTTSEAGPGGGGTVFEIANTRTGYASTAATLACFDYTDGSYPAGSLIVDASGDLLGTTLDGGANNDGTVFEIRNTATGYASVPTTVATFDGANGSGPGDLVADANGDLFGATGSGGAYENDGTVFEITNTPTGYSSAPVALYSFYLGADGSYPNTGLVIDANGDLFGTTAGSAYGSGTVFELAKTGDGYAGTITTDVSFISFDGTDADFLIGSGPSALAADANGDLFLTTSAGGTNGYGTILEVTGSGFVPSGTAPCFAAGTRIATARGEVAVEAIEVGERVRVLLGGGPDGAAAVAEVIWVGRREVDCARPSAAAEGVAGAGRGRGIRAGPAARAICCCRRTTRCTSRRC